MTYIAFLRGINVGGHIVKMDKLRELFEQLGFANVRSYIQSGNVFFDSPEADAAKLAQKIEKHLAEALGYAVPTCLRTIDGLTKAIASNPFGANAPPADQRFCIVFVADTVPKNLEVPLFAPNRDMEIRDIVGQDAYVVWYINNGRPTIGQVFRKNPRPQHYNSFFAHCVKILAAARK